MLYIGDCFEEDSARAYQLADAFHLRGFVPSCSTTHPQVIPRLVEFSRRSLAEQRCLSRFLRADTQGLRDILEAVAVLAYGGVKMIEHKKAQLPSLHHLVRELINFGSS